PDPGDPVLLHAMDRDAAEADRPLGEADLAADQVERGGLAGAVRPDQAAELALPDAEVEVRDGDEAAERHGHVVEDDQGLGRRAHVMLPMRPDVSAGGRTSSPSSALRRSGRSKRRAIISAAPAMPFGRNRTTRTNSAPMMRVQVSRKASDSDNAPWTPVTSSA